MDCNKQEKTYTKTAVLAAVVSLIAFLTVSFLVVLILGFSVALLQNLSDIGRFLSFESFQIAVFVIAAQIAYHAALKCIIKISKKREPASTALLILGVSLIVLRVFTLILNFANIYSIIENVIMIIVGIRFIIKGYYTALNK